MDQGQAVDQDSHVIAHVVLALPLLILVDDLKTVVVDVLLIQQIDVLGRAAVLAQHLDVVALYLAGLFQNAVVGAGDAGLEKAVPLAVGEGVIVQQLQLTAEVGDQTGLVVDGQVFIALGLQHPNKFPLQRRLALIALRPLGLRRIFGHHGAFSGGGDEVVLGHERFLLELYPVFSTGIAEIWIGGLKFFIGIYDLVY